jgi:uncharacterized membrane protein
MIASKDLTIIDSEESYSAKATVLSIEEQFQEENRGYGIDAETTETTTTIFYCKILNGEHKGEEVLTAQIGDALTSEYDRPVSVGDKIIVYNYTYSSEQYETNASKQYETEWIFANYVRFDTLLIFAAAFFVLLLLFGHFKGLNTIISLTFTCLAIFLVYIPSIINGQNIYASTLITCGFITIMTIMITNGWSRKSLATILGCLFGVLVAAALSLLLDSLLHLTGIIDENSIYLTYLESPINLNAVIFGSIVVGALGAVMDVAMDIASSLNEVSRQAAKPTFSSLLKSGFNIGRDIMGTMSNTLVLAYIGSSLSVVLLIITYAGTMTELLNREMIIVELMQAIIGSTAILFTIPLTTIICGLIYIRKHNHNQQSMEQKELDSTKEEA